MRERRNFWKWLKRLFIPDKEASGEVENAMSVEGWTEVMRVLKALEKLLEGTLLDDEEAIAEGLARAHMEVASILTYNDENSLGCAIGLAYYSCKKRLPDHSGGAHRMRFHGSCFSAAAVVRKAGAGGGVKIR